MCPYAWQVYRIVWIATRALCDEWQVACRKNIKFSHGFGFRNRRSIHRVLELLAYICIYKYTDINIWENSGHDLRKCRHTWPLIKRVWRTHDVVVKITKVNCVDGDFARARAPRHCLGPRLNELSLSASPASACVPANRARRGCEHSVRRYPNNWNHCDWLVAAQSDLFWLYVLTKSTSVTHSHTSPTGRNEESDSRSFAIRYILETVWAILHCETTYKNRTPIYIAAEQWV